MAWKTPKTNWTSEDTVTENDFNRIEGNIDYAMNLVEPGKTLIKQAIRDSGITIASNTPTFIELAEGVKKIGNTAGLVEPGKKLLKQTIVANGVTMATNTPTFQELADGINKIAPNITSTNATSSHILSGKKAVVQNKLVTGSMVDRGTQNKTLSEDSETYIIPKGYHDGNGKVKTNISNLYAKNIKLGEVVGGVMGNYSQIKFASGTETTVKDDSGNSSITIDFPFQPIVVVVFFPGTSDSQYVAIKYLGIYDSFTNRDYSVRAIIEDKAIFFGGGPIHSGYPDGDTFDYKVIGVID